MGSTGRMIITQIQLFLRMNAAKIAIAWGVLEVVAILVIITAGRTFAVAWWKIAVILSTIAKICYETRKSCLQAKLDDKAEELRKLQWDKMQISGNDETGSKKEAHKEHVHRWKEKEGGGGKRSRREETNVGEKKPSTRIWKLEEEAREKGESSEKLTK